MQASSVGFSAVMGGQDITVDHQVQLFIPYRTNLCTTPNFNHNTRGNWCVYGLTLGFTEAAPPTLFNGEALAGKITWNTGAANTGNLLLTFASIPGQTYTISAEAYQPASTPRLGIGAFGIAGIAAASTFGAWTRVWLTFVANDYTTTVNLFNADASTSGQVTWVTDILFEQTGSQLPYFDGDMAGARWVNDAVNSTSQLNLIGFTDASLTIESLEVNRDTTTDMPDGTRLIAGYPAADATVSMAGSFSATDPTQTPAALFNPYNTASVLYGTDPSGGWIQIAAGVYPGFQATAELITSFTGLIDDVEIDLASGAVTVAAIDYRNVLKTASVLPSFWAVPVPNSFYNASPLLTAHYGIDYLIRQAGIYSSPPPRPGCVFYQSMHGSMYPEINGGANTATCATIVGGAFITNSTQRRQFGQGMWSPQTMVGPFITGSNLDGVLTTLDFNHGIYVEYSGYFDPTIVNGYIEVDLGYNLAAGVTSEYRCQARSNGDGTVHTFGIYQPYNGTAGTAQTAAVPFAISAGYHTIGWTFTWTSATTLVVTTQMDWAGLATNTLTFTAGHTIAPWTQVNSEITQVSEAGWAVENVQVTNELVGSTYSSTHFTPTAYLDASLNDQMTTLPDPAGADPWGVLQLAMDAEQGVCGFDEPAVFRFYNRNTLKSRLSTKQLDASINLKSTQIGIQQSTVYTHVSVPVQQYTLGPQVNVWQANSPIFVPALGSITFNVETTAPVVDVVVSDAGFIPGGGGPANTWWRAGDKITGGTPITGGISIHVVVVTQTVLQVTITNTNAIGAWMVCPTGFSTAAGTPVLYVAGKLLSAVSATAETGSSDTAGAGLVADVQWPPLTEGGAALGNPRGDILLAIAGNTWQQDLDVATDFAWDTLADLYQNRPIITNADIIADPRLQLTDRNTLVVPEYGIDDDVFINGIHLTADRSTWNQELVMRAVAAPGEWVLGDAVKSILGSTTVM